MPAALHQRCLIRRARNVLAKTPANAANDIKSDYWAIFDLPADVVPGLDAVSTVQTRIGDFARRWGDTYPAGVRRLLADRAGLTHYLRTPREHWNRVRHSNFIERTFGETRRRVKAIGRLPGETSALTLIWAVLDRGWRGFTMTSAGLRLLQDLRRSLGGVSGRWRSRAAQLMSWARERFRPPPRPVGRTVVWPTSPDRDLAERPTRRVAR